MTEPLLDTNTMSALLGCSPGTITRYCLNGTLPYVLIHKGKRKTTRKLFPSAITAFLEGHTTNVLPTAPGEGEQVLRGGFC